MQVSNYIVDLVIIKMNTDLQLKQNVGTHNLLHASVFWAWRRSFHGRTSDPLAVLMLFLAMTGSSWLLLVVLCRPMAN